MCWCAASSLPGPRACHAMHPLSSLCCVLCAGNVCSGVTLLKHWTPPCFHVVVLCVSVDCPTLPFYSACSAGIHVCIARCFSTLGAVMKAPCCVTHVFQQAVEMQVHAVPCLCAVLGMMVLTVYVVVCLESTAAAMHVPWCYKHPAGFPPTGKSAGVIHSSFLARQWCPLQRWGKVFCAACCCSS